MSETPDFESYTLEELFESLGSVNKKRYPENYEAIKAAIAKKQKGSFVCSKCDSTGYEISEFRASQGGLQSVIDVESERFQTVSCVECGFTEIYKATGTSAGGKILDFLFS
ncbi:MAG: zinc ribbon domain-containing protein [Pseudomonadota bacterium]